MNSAFLLESPWMALLFKWTCLLALGWAAHGLLHRHHARWRLFLWRGILCLGLALPAARFLHAPVIRIPIAVAAVDSQVFAGPVSPAGMGVQVEAREPVQVGEPAQAGEPVPAPAVELPRVPAVEQPVTATAGGEGASTSGADNGGTAGIQETKEAASPVSSGVHSVRITTPSRAVPSRPVPWEGILLGSWAAGCGLGAARLLRLHLQLSRLRKETCRPSPDLQRLALQIQVRLNAGREVEVHVSDAVASPFVCGLFKPAIILPAGLARQLPEGELVALLSHEIAHLRQNDLAWCVAWRWMKTLCWFHPLVWKVPAVHNLACEQEADRIASGQLDGEDSYPRLLARLALRVLGLPAVETKLTLNGSSQIAWRLNHLYKRGTDAWSWRHSAAGLGLVGLLFVMSAGFDFSKASPAPLVKTIAGTRTLPAVPAGGVPEAVAADESSPQLAFELRDGSRAVGQCQKDTVSFHSALMGNFKLKWAKIRSIEYMGTNSDLARLTTTNGDMFIVTISAEALRVETPFGRTVLPAKLIRSVRSAPPPGANVAEGAPTARLAIELRDGSRVVGTSLDDILDFHNGAMGDVKLSWAGIHSIQDLHSFYGSAKDGIEMGRLTAANGDVYDVEFAASAVHVDTSFGKTDLPVKLIRSVSVSATGAGGHEGGQATDMDIDDAKGKAPMQPDPAAAGQTEDSLNKGAVRAAGPGQL